MALIVDSGAIMSGGSNSLEPLDFKVGSSVSIYVLGRDHESILVVFSQQQVPQVQGLQAGNIQEGDSFGQFRSQTLDAVGHALVQLGVVLSADVDVIGCGRIGS